MLHKITELHGRKLHATDGGIGHVADVYFDDRSWAVRYLVVNTGSWLSERLVLLAPPALGALSDEGLRVRLTRHQIEKSPPVDLHKPVSRQYEADYYAYYGWPVYWDGGLLATATGFPIVAPPPATLRQEEPAGEGHHRRLDHHLQSAQSLHGFSLAAADGEIGHVTDLLLNFADWTIRDVVARTGAWFGGHEVMLPVGKVGGVDYASRRIALHLTRQEVEHARAYHAPRK